MMRLFFSFRFGRAAIVGLGLWCLLLPSMAVGTGTIDFTYVHPQGIIPHLSGQVSGVNYSEFKVAVYLRVAGGWWNKPYHDYPTTTIDPCNGRWRCELSIACTDYLADQYCAFLIPANYDPPLTQGSDSVPQALYDDSEDFACASNLRTNPAWIEYLSIPPYGSNDKLIGRVSTVNPEDFRVAVYIYVSGWWTKPFWNQPLVPINPDGTWSCDVTTAGHSDTTATGIIAFLVPQGDSVPLGSGQPCLDAQLFRNPSVEVPRDVIGNSVTFADYEWSVKESTEPVGPGPCVFNADPSHVWVDGEGLHLSIKNQGDHWTCSEVIARLSPGYGTYIFTIESVVALDRNIVLGLFLWDSSAAQYHYREMDFEFSQWGDPEADNAQTVVVPMVSAFRQWRYMF